MSQPPSGGCVLKHQKAFRNDEYKKQPPSGGCVLKLVGGVIIGAAVEQPPSGGCVLKPLAIGVLFGAISGSHLRVAVC